MKILALCILALSCAALQAQVPQSGLKLWLRADSLVQKNAQSELVTWKNIVDLRSAIVPVPSTPVLTSTINGRSAFVLDGAGYIEAPSMMPVGADYTLVVVAKVNNTVGANNIVSGNNRAFWLNNSLNPRMLHNGNFGQQAVSTVAMNELSILRVRYNNATGIARLAVNNLQGAADPIPANTDSVVFIGSYARGNFFTGAISEVLIYERELEGADLIALDMYLHARYAVPRVPDPLPPLVVFDVLPQSLLVAKCNDSLFIKGRVNSTRVRSVNIIVDSNGVVVSSKNITGVIVGSSFNAGFFVQQGQHLYNVVVTLDTGGVVRDTALNSRNIACGEVIAITGQSNSIWGAPGTVASPWARTYGSNSSAQRADTAYKPSSADGFGGGPDVGAFGLYLQNRIAETMKVPTLVINGGVGGTRIEQHLPDPDNRLNLSTIYGSWLYRVITSGSSERIRWLFWYQGESNGDNDDYLALFDQLYSAWKIDLPNLQYVVVIQIRPGCGPNGHEKIRDAQRKLEYRHTDVIVHAASGLPFHDGCHYGSDGYFALGEQLFNIYRINELSLQPGRFVSAPTISAATCTNQPCNNIRLQFRRADQLRMTPDVSVGGSMRTARDAFYANGDPTMLPLSVSVTSDAVELQFASPVTRVSYIPDKNYVNTAVVYEGPWLVTSTGVGAITFNNIDVQPTSVAGERYADASSQQSFVVERGQPLRLGAHKPCSILDLRGRIVATSPEDVAGLPEGIYVAHLGYVNVRVIVVP